MKIKYKNELGETFHNAEIVHYGFINRHSSKLCFEQVSIYNLTPMQCEASVCTTEIFKNKSGVIYGVKALLKIRKNENRRKL